MRARSVALLLVVALASLAGPSGMHAERPDLELRTSFPGIERAQYSGGPHLSIAAGTESVILSSTAGIEIRAKDGTPIAAASSDELFAAVKHPQAGLGDLTVLFDHFSERYFIVVIDRIDSQHGCVPGTCLAHLLLAVSKTTDPRTLTTSSWHVYALDNTLDFVDGEATRNDHWNDWPSLTATPDFVVLVTQQEPASPGAYAVDHRRPFKVRVLEKAPLLNGTAPAQWSDILSPQDGHSYEWLVPALAAEDAATAFLVGHGRGNLCGFTVWGLDQSHVDGLPRGLRGAAASSALSCEYAPVGAPQRGSDVLLDATPSLIPMLFPMYRDGSVWVARTVGMDYGGGVTGAVHWAELDVRAWPDRVEIVQEGLVGEDGVFSHLPAIGVDGAGNAVLVFHRSGEDEYASIYYAGRAASDPPGTMREPRVLKGGSGAIPPADPPFFRTLPPDHTEIVPVSRFADTAGVAYDPATNDLWVFGQYGDQAHLFATWAGRIGWSGAPAPSMPVGDAGVFKPHPSATGITITRWSGGSIESVAEAVGPRLRSLWVFRQGRPVGFTAGAPSFVNAEFLGLFPEGALPEGEIVLVVRGP
jgi:hypothetical protein